MRFNIVPVSVLTFMLIVSLSSGITADTDCAAFDGEGIQFLDDMSDHSLDGMDAVSVPSSESIDDSDQSPGPDKATIGMIAFIAAIVLGVATVLVARWISSKKAKDQTEE